MSSDFVVTGSYILILKLIPMMLHAGCMHMMLFIWLVSLETSFVYVRMVVIVNAKSSEHKARRTYSRLCLFTNQLNCREQIGS